jgi:chromosome segregation ATPase
MTTNLAELSSRASALSQGLGKVRARAEAAEAARRRLQDSVTALEADERLAELSATVLRQLIDNEVTVSVKAVEELLTDGLRAVFEDQELSVRATVSIERGKVSIDLVTVQVQPDGTVVEGSSPEAFGGAVTTVQSVLLRTIVIVRRGLRPVMFLDETLPAFDANYVNNMGGFLRALCEKLGMDILLVSHNPAMVEAADRSYRIVKHDGRATFKKLR